MAISTLIQTKLQRPRLGQDLIARPRLIHRLNRGLDRKLTLISAQAGAGKTTLLAQWLDMCPMPSAWLSLDEYDNDLMVFVSYLCAALQTIIPDACGQVVELISASQTPPQRVIITTLVNELHNLFGRHKSSTHEYPAHTGFILALDDYYKITEPTIHQLLSEMLVYLPHRLHLALTSRIDPPLPLAGLRVRGEMTELRTHNLRLSQQEAGALLESVTGRGLSPSTIELLEEKTDGWAVGLRLAAISIRDLPDDLAFVEAFKGTSSTALVDYLVSEVLSKQSPVKQNFLLQTSILKRFNADLCDAILWPDGDTGSLTANSEVISSRDILRELTATNLFLIPLDHEEWWYRYHHLFDDLLFNRLRRLSNLEHIATLHLRASDWFERNGFIEEALQHAFSAGNLELAAQIVARQRYLLMNQARWVRLNRYHGLFPPEFASQQPDLLMLKTWLLHHQAHYSQLPVALEQLEVALAKGSLSTESERHLKGEMSALRSLLAYFGNDVDQTIVEAETALRNTVPELWIVRILARVYLAGAYQMRGDLEAAYDAIYQGIDQEVVQSNIFKATVLITVCSLQWVVADLHGLAQSARQSIGLFDNADATEIEGYAHYHLGCALYQQNDLVAAEEHFARVVQRPYLNYGECFAYSAFGLSLTYQAQNRPEEASEVATSAVAHLLEIGNLTSLREAQAFQAELAVRQGKLGLANQWANQFDSGPRLTPMPGIYRPQLTLAKVWLMQDSPASREKAAVWLDQLRSYTETTRNTSVLIEVLALQAILLAADGDEHTALTQLEKAIELAQPGGFVRLFVDLGQPIAHLLKSLHDRGFAPDYVSQILASFPESKLLQEQRAVFSPKQSSLELVEPLTVREMEVLELLAKRLTNKEIAARLFVSPGTIKTHTLSIYAKLDVHGRRQAVKRARELSLISPT